MQRTLHYAATSKTLNFSATWHNEQRESKSQKNIARYRLPSIFNEDKCDTHWGIEQTTIRRSGYGSPSNMTSRLFLALNKPHKEYQSIIRIERLIAQLLRILFVVFAPIRKKLCSDHSPRRHACRPTPPRPYTPAAATS